jgi:hypothetical protein
MTAPAQKTVDGSLPNAAGSPGRSLAARWIGAARLDAGTFAGVVADPGALGQALVVVLAGGISRGVGALAEEGWLGLIGGSALGVGVWLVAAVLVFCIGVQLLGHASGFPELLRTLGFAAAPLVTLALCAALPAPAARFWWGAVHVWATFAFVIAVREALGVSTLRALTVCVAAIGIAFALLFSAAAFLFDTAFID